MLIICWLCGKTKAPEDSFISLWGITETKKRHQDVAKTLLVESGKALKIVSEEDRVCGLCRTQIYKRVNLVDRKAKKPDKRKLSKKRLKEMDSSSSEDESCISLTSGSTTGPSQPRVRNVSPKKKKDAVSKLPEVITLKTGRTVKAPERFAEKPEANKRSPPKTVVSKAEPQNQFADTYTTKKARVVPSVSSLNLSTIFGDDNIVCVEVCIDNVQSAVACFKGGARRIELCSSLSEGGLTPSCGFLREVKSLVKIPVFAMIRPRGGDFLYTDAEIDVMKYDIKNYKHNGADGFVFGVLDKSGYIDVAKCRALLQAADPLPCTFHRAFDYVSEPLNSLETVIKLGFTRLLTSGQKITAAEGIPLIKELVQKARGRISIMAGAGINPQCVGNIVARTGVKEVHASARVKVPSAMAIRDRKDGLSMGQNPADDFCLLITDANAVAQIVKAAEDAAESTKLITIF